MHTASVILLVFIVFMFLMWRLRDRRCVTFPSFFCPDMGCHYHSPGEEAATATTRESPRGNLRAGTSLHNSQQGTRSSRSLLYGGARRVNSAPADIWSGGRRVSMKISMPKPMCGVSGEHRRMAHVGVENGVIAGCASVPFG